MFSSSFALFFLLFSRENETKFGPFFAFFLCLTLPGLLPVRWSKMLNLFEPNTVKRNNDSLCHVCIIQSKFIVCRRMRTAGQQNQPCTLFDATSFSPSAQPTTDFQMIPDQECEERKQEM